MKKKKLITRLLAIKSDQYNSEFHSDYQKQKRNSPLIKFHNELPKIKPSINKDIFLSTNLHKSLNSLNTTINTINLNNNQFNSPYVIIDQIHYPKLFQNNFSLKDSHSPFKTKIQKKNDNALSMKYLELMHEPKEHDYIFIKNLFHNNDNFFENEIIEKITDNNVKKNILARLKVEKEKENKNIENFVRKTLNKSKNLSFLLIEKIPNEEIENYAEMIYKDIINKRDKNIIKIDMNENEKNNNLLNKKEKEELIIHKIFLEFVIDSTKKKIEFRNQYNKEISIEYISELIRNEIKKLKIAVLNMKELSKKSKIFSTIETNKNKLSILNNFFPLTDRHSYDRNKVNDYYLNSINFLDNEENNENMYITGIQKNHHILLNKDNIMNDKTNTTNIKNYINKNLNNNIKTIRNKFIESYKTKDEKKIRNNQIYLFNDTKKNNKTENNIILPKIQKQNKEKKANADIINNMISNKTEEDKIIITQPNKEEKKDNISTNKINKEEKIKNQNSNNKDIVKDNNNISYIKNVIKDNKDLKINKINEDKNNKGEVNKDKEEELSNKKLNEEKKEKNKNNDKPEEIKEKKELIKNNNDNINKKSDEKEISKINEIKKDNLDKLKNNLNQDIEKDNLDNKKQKVNEDKNIKEEKINKDEEKKINNEKNKSIENTIKNNQRIENKKEENKKEEIKKEENNSKKKNKKEENKKEDNKNKKEENKKEEYKKEDNKNKKEGNKKEDKYKKEENKSEIKNDKFNNKISNNFILMNLIPNYKEENKKDDNKINEISNSEENNETINNYVFNSNIFKNESNINNNNNNDIKKDKKENLKLKLDENNLFNKSRNIETKSKEEIDNNNKNENKSVGVRRGGRFRTIIYPQKRAIKNEPNNNKNRRHSILTMDKSDHYKNSKNSKNKNSNILEKISNSINELKKDDKKNNRYKSPNKDFINKNRRSSLFKSPDKFINAKRRSVPNILNLPNKEEYINNHMKKLLVKDKKKKHKRKKKKNNKTLESDESNNKTPSGLNTKLSISENTASAEELSLKEDDIDNLLNFINNENGKKFKTIPEVDNENYIDNNLNVSQNEKLTKKDLLEKLKRDDSEIKKYLERLIYSKLINQNYFLKRKKRLHLVYKRKDSIIFRISGNFNFLQNFYKHYQLKKPESKITSSEEESESSSSSSESTENNKSLPISFFEEETERGKKKLIYDNSYLFKKRKKKVPIRKEVKDIIKGIYKDQNEKDENEEKGFDKKKYEERFLESYFSRKKHAKKKTKMARKSVIKEKQAIILDEALDRQMYLRRKELYEKEEDREMNEERKEKSLDWRINYFFNSIKKLKNLSKEDFLKQFDKYTEFDMRDLKMKKDKEDRIRDFILGLNDYRVTRKVQRKLFDTYVYKEPILIENYSPDKFNSSSGANSDGEIKKTINTISKKNKKY